VNKQLYDIEVFKNFFCVGIKNYVTKEILFYEISEEKDDRELIHKWFTEYTGFLVSFNGIHYDNMVVKYFISKYNDYENLNWSNITTDLKWFSDKLIRDEYDDEIKQIKYQKIPWIDIDLFLYWSKMLRLSKKISLKSLGIQLNYHTVQELPYKPETILTIEDLPKLRYYNYTHDLGILELLTENMEEDIKLRGYIQKEYGLECWSMDAPKIASEYLLEYYCKNTYIENKNSYWYYKKNIRNTKYEPKPWIIGDYLPIVEFKTKFFQDIYNEISTTSNSANYLKNKLLQQKNHNVMLTVSQGGIHSVNNNQQYKEEESFYIIDADVAGLYPTLFRKYKFLRKSLWIILEKYIEMIDDRTIAKRTGDKKKDTFLKLCNNAFSGLVDSTVTWMYSPEHILALRVFGQMIQLRFMEELNFHDIEILFTNTDGTLVKCPKNKLEIYHKIALDISKEFEIEWEFAVVKQIFFANTNTYLSEIKEEYMLDENISKINIKNISKIKKKGKYFKYGKDIPLGDSVDEQIIAKALEAYYINNILPQEFISNPDKYNLHIYDYCKSNKIGKDFKVWHNGKIQQQLNRYYFSKNAPYLFKQKHGTGTMQHVNVGGGVILFNNYEKKSYKEYLLNYQYYISKTQKIIDEINNLNQLLLF
jgi:hypothetical protein